MGCTLTTEEVAHIDRTIADLKSENAKLREQIYWLKKGDILHVLTDQEYIDQCERERLMQVSIDALDDENAKLRGLVARMAHVLRADDEWQDPFYCNPYCADTFRCRSDDCVEVQCPIVKSMRELGVEP